MLNGAVHVVTNVLKMVKLVCPHKWLWSTFGVKDNLMNSQTNEVCVLIVKHCGMCLDLQGLRFLQECC
jgi:hypothetical protein